MARIYADNVVFLMRPGETSRRRVDGLPETRIPRSSEQAAPGHRASPCTNAPLGYSHTLAPRLAVQGEARQHQETPAHRAPLHWVLLLVAACVLPMAALTWRAVARQASLQHYATAIGGQRTLPLAGGGSALLDTATSVSMAAGAPPAVTLERGRAQFDANGQAITVHAGGGIVRASAGRFQVSRLADAVRVTALAGTVTVQLPAGEGQATLRAGQQVDYGYGRLGSVRPADLAAARGWPRGELVFHRRSLAELVAAMNHYSDTRLVIGDAALRNLPVSGVFEAGDPLALTQALQRSRLLRAVRVGPDEIRLQPAAR